jgi:glycosyltransferase involved in cell wall biosynthesis
MEQQTINLARGYAAFGDDVTIGYVQRNPLTDEAPLRAAGIKVVDLNAVGPIRRILSIPRFAKLARRADIVHCTGWDASGWGRIAGWLARRPVVVTEHASPGRETQKSSRGRSSGRVISLHNRLLDPMTAATVVVAEAQIERLERDGVKRRKIHLIPNGVSLEKIRTAARDGVTRAELGIPDDAKLLVHIGRLIPQKRQEWTYEAVKLLREELGEIHVIFAGVGPTLEPLQRQAEADAADWAHFLGFRQDIAALLSISDLAVLPSETEALPMVVIEAIALAVPQVATDVGDVKRVLEESGAGLVVGRYDREGYIEACRRSLQDEDLAEQQRVAARSGADAFEVDTMVARYEQLFDELSDARDKPRFPWSPRRSRQTSPS